MEALASGDEVPPAERSADRTRRNPWNMVLAAACVLLLVGAGAVLVTSRSSTAASTSDLDAASATLEQQHDDLRDQADRDDELRQDLADAGNDLTQALYDLDPAVAALGDAANALVDTDNQALGDYDRGRAAAADGMLDGQGAAQVADVTAKAKALQDSIADIQAKAARLKELLGG